VNPRLKKFLSYYKPYRGLLIADMVCALLVSLITLALPLLVNRISKAVLLADAAAANREILVLGGIMFLLTIVYMYCNYFVDYWGHMMGALMERDMRKELFAHYHELSFGFYDEHKTGQLLTLITSDSFSLSEFYHHGPEDLAIAILKLVGVFAIFFWINWQLALLILAFLPFIAVYGVYFNRKMHQALRASKDRIGFINAQVEDTLAGIRTVKSFTNEQIEMEKFGRENDLFVLSRSEGYKGEAYFFTGMLSFMQLITIVVIVVGGLGIVQGMLDLGDFLTYVLCIGILNDPINRINNFVRLYQEGTTSFKRFMDLLELKPEVQDLPHAGALGPVQGDISFSQVGFAYTSSPKPVFQELDLSIKAGEYVALVGTSGVGKSTLCSLIPRFYDVTSGTIRIDGHDIRSVTQASLREQIGVVQQDVYLFAGSIADNIRYGKREASMEEVIAAAKQANAHDFIMALPQGYDTDIGQRGVKLSGGQKQRISIARVFLKNPPIIIFDEATSSLDNESERAVQESLERLSDNRTTIVIAHRLSTVRNADRIIVLDEGGVAEEGDHHDLLEQNGAYARLYNLQLTF
jgi:ATP-binding cassette subfamily B protein